MSTSEFFKNILIAAGIAASAWTAAIEIKYNPERDENIRLEKTILSLKDTLSQKESNLVLTPKYIALKNKSQKAELSIEQHKQTVTDLEKKIIAYDVSLKNARTQCAIIQQISIVREEKRAVDNKLRCEVDFCAGQITINKSIDEAVVKAFQKQSNDLQEQVNLLIGRLSAGT